MLRMYNSVVNFYEICLTAPVIFTSLPPNAAGRGGASTLRNRGSKVVAAVLAVGLAACATVDSRPAAEVVKERAEARAKANMTGNTQAMYDFFSPTVRKTLKYQDYASGLKTGFWKAVTVDKVECAQPDVCTVSMTVTYVHKGATMKSPLSETWIREGQDWWYAVKG